MTTQDPTTYSDPMQGKIKHIDFQIKVDFVTSILDIEATYQLDKPISGTLFLDSYKIDLKQAQANDRELTWEFDKDDEVVGQRLQLQGLDNDSSFKLVFRTSPEARALQWMKPSQTSGGEHPFLYSQCQATHARSIFPCQDAPLVRFTYSAEVEVPSALRAVMAAEQVDGEEGNGRFTFKMLQPIPSYLFALAVGNFEFRELGPRTGIYAEPETINAAAWEFAETEKTIDEAEKLLGPYLWDRYDMLVLPPSFPFGGMENPRLTFLTPTCILGTRGQTSLITHELAHAWTGNLVTNATWQDFWLNEGWTTYAETRITEVLNGKDEHDLHAVYNAKRLFAVMERFGMDSPATKLKQRDDEKDADSFTTLVAYYKGCFFLRECELAIGRERFDKFIHKYIKSFQFQSLTTEGFLDFLKSELPDVFEKVNVQKWVYEPGMPEEWHKPQSKLYEGIENVLDAYKKGERPTREQVKDWGHYQTLSFLQGLPDKVTVDDCKYLEDILDIEKANDSAFYANFYALCIASGYQEIMPRIEEFTGRVGRMYYLFPIFRAMIALDWAREQARPLFERVKEKHHQITIKTIDGFLKKAGL
ncbi:MAG TPA: leukotriene A4 hydrolase C-terminal domain-containing protein [Anaerolineales bacterium]|nr:leukotriene A4 hydrolase C-terminal domain-containing protein [Anaerolineales bacterium]